jgi:RimJ/RimL family protein N-acetyltransferase
MSNGVDPARIELPAQLLGPRVLLRPYREDDAQQLWDVIDSSREHLAPWMPWIQFYQSLEDARVQARRLAARWLMREELTMGIFERASGRLLGGSGLTRIDWTIRRFEIGYWLAPSAIGHGYVTETVQVLTRFAFAQLHANRVLIRMDVGNARSRAVPERLGFVYEGCLRNELPDSHGQPVDIDVFALLPDDYQRLNWPAVT